MKKLSKRERAMYFTFTSCLCVVIYTIYKSVDISSDLTAVSVVLSPLILLTGKYIHDETKRPHVTNNPNE